MEYKDYTDEELFKEYCAFYLMNYVYNQISCSELRMLGIMQKEVENNRSSELKEKLVKEIKKMNKIDVEKAQEKLHGR